MRTALQLHQLRHDTAADSFGRIGRSTSPALPRPRDLTTDSANDARFARSDDGEATVQRTLAANGFGEAALARDGQYAHLSSAALNAVARSHRSAGLVAVHREMFSAVADGLRQLWIRFRRRQQSRATYLALQSLDDRALRDIGVDRSEILSLAQQIEDPRSATREFALHYLRGH